MPPARSIPACAAFCSRQDNTESFARNKYFRDKIIRTMTKKKSIGSQLAALRWGKATDADRAAVNRMLLKSQGKKLPKKKVSRTA